MSLTPNRNTHTTRSKFAKLGGACKAHGGSRRCKAHGCGNFEKAGGFCQQHQGNPSTISLAEATKASGQRRATRSAHDATPISSTPATLDDEILEDDNRLAELKRQMENLQSKREEKLKRRRLMATTGLRSQNTAASNAAGAASAAAALASQFSQSGYQQFYGNMPSQQLPSPYYPIALQNQQRQNQQ